VAFDAGGSRALASGARSVYLFDGSRWHETSTPSGAAPARLLASGGVAGRAYMAGQSGLHRSDDWGRSWAPVGAPLGKEAVSAIVVAPGRPQEVYALAADQVWASRDGAVRWQVLDGAPAQVDVLGFDRQVPARLWLVAAGRAYRGDGAGQAASRWQPVAAALPDPLASARGIDVRGDAMLVATDRGVFRSIDAGASWALLAAELPNHAESALLVSDPQALATVYAGFARLNAQQVIQALPARPLVLAGADLVLILGSYAGVAALLLVAGLMVRRATRASERKAQGPLPIEAPTP
jgi:photosystem II stability/assembly factor-like uncharacterized protein